jgi:hypothetical protein
MIERGNVAAEVDAGSPGSGGASPHPAPGLLILAVMGLNPGNSLAMGSRVRIPPS